MRMSRMIIFWLACATTSIRPIETSRPRRFLELVLDAQLHDAGEAREDRVTVASADDDERVGRV